MTLKLIQRLDKRNPQVSAEWPVRAGRSTTSERRRVPAQSERLERES